MFRQLVLCAALMFIGSPAAAQHAAGHDHAAHAGASPTEAGNAVFAALAEVIALLEADSATDWSRVDIEGLRQHLLDMDDVIMNAVVATSDVPGGVRFDVTGESRTSNAIRRMAAAHAQQPDVMRHARITVTGIPGGARVTVLTDDTHTLQKVRALGFAGLLVQGQHHGPHHLAIARGDHVHH
jgi:hypothetical protein